MEVVIGPRRVSTVGKALSTKKLRMMLTDMQARLRVIAPTACLDVEGVAVALPVKVTTTSPSTSKRAASTGHERASSGALKVNAPVVVKAALNSTVSEFAAPKAIIISKKASMGEPSLPTKNSPTKSTPSMKPSSVLKPLVAEAKIQKSASKSAANSSVLTHLPPSATTATASSSSSSSSNAVKRSISTSAFVNRLSSSSVPESTGRASSASDEVPSVPTRYSTPSRVEREKADKNSTQKQISAPISSSSKKALATPTRKTTEFSASNSKTPVSSAIKKSSTAVSTSLTTPVRSAELKASVSVVKVPGMSTPKQPVRPSTAPSTAPKSLSTLSTSTNASRPVATPTRNVIVPPKSGSTALKQPASRPATVSTPVEKSTSSLIGKEKRSSTAALPSSTSSVGLSSPSKRAEALARVRANMNKQQPSTTANDLGSMSKDVPLIQQESISIPPSKSTVPLEKRRQSIIVNPFAAISSVKPTSLNTTSATDGVRSRSSSIGSANCVTHEISADHLILSASSTATRNGTGSLHVSSSSADVPTSNNKSASFPKSRYVESHGFSLPPPPPSLKDRGGNDKESHHSNTVAESSSFGRVINKFNKSTTGVSNASDSELNKSPVSNPFGALLS